MKFLKPSFIFWFVLGAFIVEILMLTFLRSAFGNNTSALLSFLVSLSVGITGIRLSFFNEKQPVKKISSKVPLALCGLLIIGAIILFKQIFVSTPIDVEDSDIIPQVQVLTYRFLHHQFPYTVISDWGYDLFPTYLPLHWIPFTIAEIFGFDYRWIAVIPFLAVSLFLVVLMSKKNVSPFKSIIIIVAFFLPVLFIKMGEPSIYGITIESLITAYYLLLSLSLLSNKRLLLACAIVCCLLSRYSIVFWVPLYFFILYVSGERRKLKFFLIAIVSGVLLLYILPFMLHDKNIFLEGYHYHTKAALSEWSRTSSDPGEKPFQLFQGVGFAGMFYDHVSGTAMEKLDHFKLIHLLMSFLSVVVLGAIFSFKRNKVDPQLFALGSLKIYLVIFYYFIQIPYDYLYLVPVYISIPILFAAATRNNFLRSSLPLR